MDRRKLIGAFAGSSFALARIASGQTAGKLPVVGVLVTDSVGNISLPILIQGLRDLGYIDGKNIVIAVRSAGGVPAALAAHAADLVQLNVDVIYATGPAAIRAAKEATSTIPIVALDLETDPVEAGWARSLARPGGNLTGLFLDVPGLAGKWLELLNVAAPAVRHIGLVWVPSTGSAQMRAAKAAAPRFALDVQVIEVHSANDLDAALGAGVRAGARALVMLSSPLIATSATKLAAVAAKNGLPAISPFRRFAEAGGLLSYGPDFDDFRARSASYIDKILKRAKPGDLPIQQPTKFELVINLKTAKALGLTIPQSLLLRADEVIQ
jgi:putative tryptophan/tyrosine transport system substrate-binding protein